VDSAPHGTQHSAYRDATPRGGGKGEVGKRHPVDQERKCRTDERPQEIRWGKTRQKVDDERQKTPKRQKKAPQTLLAGPRKRKRRQKGEETPTTRQASLQTYPKGERAPNPFPSLAKRRRPKPQPGRKRKIPDDLGLLGGKAKSGRETPPKPLVRGRNEIPMAPNRYPVK